MYKRRLLETNLITVGTFGSNLRLMLQHAASSAPLTPKTVQSSRSCRHHIKLESQNLYEDSSEIFRAVDLIRATSVSGPLNIVQVARTVLA